MKVAKKILSYLLFFFAVIVLAVLLRLLLFSVYTIPTESMEPSIMAGDRIIANKLIPGPRIFKSLEFIETGEKPHFWRLKGVRTIKRNDVLVFNFPYTDWSRLRLTLQEYYVKRCIAIPGDTLRITGGYYNVLGCNDTLGYYDSQQQIAKTPDEAFDKAVYDCFPFDSRMWTIKEFGPVYIPAKGDILKIDSTNIALYKNIIEYESGEEISTTNGELWLGVNRLDTYTFRTNYYFMAGDKATDSKDSRYWGLLPEDHIIGKAAIVWRSKDPRSGKYIRSRFLKIIR